MQFRSGVRENSQWSRSLKLLREVYITGGRAYSAEGTAYAKIPRLGIAEVFKDRKCGWDKVHRRQTLT